MEVPEVELSVCTEIVVVSSVEIVEDSSVDRVIADESVVCDTE